ncbi:DUF551 domain-containing protein [Escherichia albertii]|uniref:DUF551 domain-containing protein n=1 Tax=Escherichia albertii TaxID=208962 RepID=UPI002360F438|nr:DUF551 domain-containing protein [Escherichia albertii]WDC12530.1 DUF551 domain-containing protein [Escherichia albertii]
MNTLTKEWLQNTITSIESARDEIPFGLDEDQNNMLTAFKIALASLEAEPIGAFHIAEQQVDGTSDYIKDGEWPIDNGIIEVYAAPPVPVVPAALPENDDEDGHDIDYLEPSEVYALGRTSGWNACRAAMLHSAEPVSQAYKLNALAGNYPVTPDGWISCSERMPDDGQHVIILCDGAFVLYAQYRDGEFFDIVRNGDEFFETQSRNVTDWMPLPEPPQEVK